MPSKTRNPAGQSEYPHSKANYSLALHAVCRLCNCVSSQTDSKQEKVTVAQILFASQLMWLLAVTEKKVSCSAWLLCCKFSVFFYDLLCSRIHSAAAVNRQTDNVCMISFINNLELDSCYSRI